VFYKILGYVNLSILMFNISPFVLRIITQHILKSRSPDVWKIIRILKKVHKITGITLLVTGFIHGFIALGYRFYIHTGYLLWFSVVTLFLIYAFRKFMKRSWIKVHRTVAVVALALLVVHLVYPWLI
jgi:hypothetical protein